MITTKYLENFKERPEVIPGNGTENVLKLKEESCACCAIFFADYAAEELGKQWGNPRGLRALVKELLDEGFGHLAMPALCRWQQIAPKSSGYTELRLLVTDQIWVAGTSRRIHDMMRPMSDSDIDEVVKHDMALLEKQWAEDEQGQATKTIRRAGRQRLLRSGRGSR